SPRHHPLNHTETPPLHTSLRVHSNHLHKHKHKHTCPRFILARFALRHWHWHWHWHWHRHRNANPGLVCLHIPEPRHPRDRPGYTRNRQVPPHLLPDHDGDKVPSLHGSDDGEYRRRHEADLRDLCGLCDEESVLPVEMPVRCEAFDRHLGGWL
ncbi:hypothetical protein AOCH_004630, partial [Aspergillus ochraceoroseus]